MKQFSVTQSLIPMPCLSDDENLDIYPIIDGLGALVFNLITGGVGLHSSA